MAERILVILPNWVGDVVMATPVLAALRAQHSEAQITYLMRGYVREIVAGAGWHDDELLWPRSKGWRGALGTLACAANVRRAHFDAAVVLTNAFRSAAVTWLGGVRRRIGYDRDRRGWMLTDRLQPMRLAGEFVPVPILPYYARLVERLGVRVPDWRLRLVVTPDQARAGDALQRHYDLSAGNYAVINPGAAFGAAKCWQPEGFAAVCDALRDQLGWQPVLVGAPGELDLLRRIAAGARGPVTLVDEPGTTLGSLKPLIRDAAVLVCNDTGPRHYGLAFDVPTVTIFGPTFQEWTDTHHPREIKLQARVRCGPCQLKRCPLDHACMKRITPEMVVDAVRRACDTRRLQATAP